MTSTKALTTINLSDDVIAVFTTGGDCGRWEVYYVVDGLEIFSHFATPGEDRQFAQACRGGLA